MNYYSVDHKVKPSGATAFAYSPEEFAISHDLIPKLQGRHELPFSLNMISVTASASGLTKSDDLTGLDTWADYLPNNLVWPFMSDKLKAVIEANLTGQEKISWIKAPVKHRDEERIYHILRFEQKPDVLDLEKTMFVKGTDHILMPHFSKEKTERFAIFNMPELFWQITASIYVNETIKKAVAREKLTGIAFEKIAMN